MFWENFINLCKKKGKTPNGIAKELKISSGSITAWKNGRVPKWQTLEILSNYFETSIEELISNKEKDPQIPVIPTKKGVKIPVLGNVAAGIPIDAVEDVIDYKEIPEEMAKNGEYFGLRIDGDSMSPRIEKGDVVIVRKQSTVDNGNIAIVLINGGQASCKKVKFEDNGLMLISFNPAYEPMFFTKEECQTKPVQILGKVVELRGKF